MPDVLWVIQRALSFALLLQAAGVAIFVAVLGRRLARAPDCPILRALTDEDEK
jgi:hypothetical protein